MSATIHPFLLGEKKKIVFFFLHLIKEVIKLRKYGHFSTVLSWGVFFFLFLYRAGVRTTIIFEVVTFNLHSTVLSISAWF